MPIRSPSLPCILAAALATPARADLQLCNRMSYVVETALGIEDKGAAATRGWFRIDPGQCRVVLQGEVQAETPATSTPGRCRSTAPRRCRRAATPTSASARTTSCWPARATARRAAARSWRASPQVKPSETDKGLTVYLAEEAEYTDDQARDAAIQRLLNIAGYDVSPIDGIRGAKTDAALLQFIADNKLTPTAAGRSDFFDVLIAAAQRPEGTGFVWCNETPHVVMAALGVAGKRRGGDARLVSRRARQVPAAGGEGPGAQAATASREAIGANGQPIQRAERPLAWGGETILCTRNVKFELIDHKDCAGQGLTAAGFATVELAGRAGTRLRFK